MNQRSDTQPSTPTEEPGRSLPPESQRNLPPAAQRALAEAEERRRQRQAETAATEKELGGRAGPDPVRYGDWENGGIASDF